MQKKKRSISIIVIVIVAVMAVTMTKAKIIDVKESNTAMDLSQKDLGIPTEITEVTSRNLTEEISYLGTIGGKSSVMVSPKITSEVKEINFKEGDIVQKGDILVSLDDSQFRAKLNTTIRKIETLELNLSYLDEEVVRYYDSNPSIKKIEVAEKNHDYLKKEVEKYKTLYENGAIPQDSYNKVKHEKDILEIQLEELKATSENAYNKLTHERNMAEMQLKELHAMVEELKLTLEETSITSPIKGKIRTLHYNVGDLAMTGKPVATVDDVENLIIKINVGELDLVKMRIGTKVMVNIDAKEEPIEARVTNILPSVNPVTRIGIVEVDFSHEEKQDIMMGSSVSVKFIVNEIEEGVVLENGFIKKLAEREIVYVFKEGYVYEKEIKTGLVIGNKTQVLEGLETGEEIAYKNLNTLYDGAKVYVFEGVDKE